MGGAPGGSTLGAMQRRKDALLKQRKALTGGAERGAPQAPTRANPQPPPPPRAPAQERGSARGGGQEAAPQEAGGTREERLAQTAEFLNNQGSQAQGQVPLPQEPGIRDASVRQNATTTLQDRLQQLGAAERSLETQFFRLAGRMGSPNELALLSSRLELERQLKRPPTQGEFQNFVAKPGSLGPLFSPAVERPQAEV